MSVVLWAVLALIAGLVGIAIGARRTLPTRPPLELAPGETLVPTVLQRLARRSLATGVVLSLTAGGTVLWAGAERFYQEDGLRVTVTLLLLAALVSLALFGMRAASWARTPDGPLDERDQAILERAPALEGMPMILALAVWVIGLQQTFWSAGAVPLVYLYLMFWSLLIVKAMALPVGVLVGYRRS